MSKTYSLSLRKDNDKEIIEKIEELKDSGNFGSINAIIHYLIRLGISSKGVRDDSSDGNSGGN